MIDVVDDFGAGSGPAAGHPREIRQGFMAEVGKPFVGYQILEVDQEIAAGTLDLLKGL